MYVLLEFWQKIMAIPIMNPLSWFTINYLNTPHGNEVLEVFYIFTAKLYHYHNKIYLLLITIYCILHTRLRRTI